MKLSQYTWLAAKLFLAFLLPVLAYVWINHSVLKSHIKSEVVNDPETSLYRSLSALQLSLDRQNDELSSKASILVTNDRLVGGLTPPRASLNKLKSLAQDISSSITFPLFILTDPSGGVIYDTLHLPQPTPSPTPSPSATPV